MLCRVWSSFFHESGSPAEASWPTNQAEDTRVRLRGKTAPDILGISTDSTADSRGRALNRLSRGASIPRPTSSSKKFGGTAPVYRSLIFSFPAGPKQTGEVLFEQLLLAGERQPRYFRRRNLTFAQDQQPSKAI